VGVTKMKYIILALFLVIFSSFVFADTSQIYVPYNVYAEIKNGSQYVAVDNATLTITKPNGSTLISEFPMSNIGTGRFSYNFTPDILGIWLLSVNYNLDNVTIGSAQDQLNVLQSYTGSSTENYNASLTPNVCINNEGGMSLLYLFIGIAIIMILIGLIFQKGVILILGGLGLILTAFFLFPCSLWFGIIITGIGLIFAFMGFFYPLL
jgi:hypothetical protein